MKFALCILFAVVAHLVDSSTIPAASKSVKAKAQILLRSSGNNVPAGEIELEEIKNPDGSVFVQLCGKLRGIFPANAKHGMHVHVRPDYSAGCDSVGEHFNPTNSKHGDISQPLGHRHVGDLGNVWSDKDGNVDFKINDNLIRLGGGLNSVVGLPIVIHVNEDDLGLKNTDLSKTEGSSGTRLACGTIEFVQ